MISIKHRFHGHNSLNYVYRNGQTARCDMLSLRYASSKGQDYRLAVVVSKKVSKSAVVRNRIRRRIYEVVRKEKISRDDPWKCDMVVTVFDERVATMTADELRANLLKLLQKAKIIPDLH